KLRERGNAILTNPDMLHQGILPYHARWSRFLSNLRFVVVDEVHTDRGSFGSHVANVLRRLRRIARHYGAEPQFLLSSATVRNPQELAEILVGDDVHIVDNDGSPRGPKLFVLWNPRTFGPDSPERRSASVDAERILVALMKRGVQSIVFTKARVVAELIYRYARERLERESRGLADLMRHPSYFFGQSPENAVLDPENPYVLASQLSCAAYELPLREEDEAVFGRRATAIAELLEEEGSFKSLDGLRYWSSAEYPAGKVNLRTISDDTFTILDQTRENAVLGTVDSISAPELLYPEAIYLHEGDTYFVRDLDLKQKIAYVEPRGVDYYTQPVLDTHLKLEETRESKKLGGETIGLGPAAVSWATVAMKKIRFRSLDAIGYHPLDLPRQKLDTVALWIQPGEGTRNQVKIAGMNPRE